MSQKRRGRATRDDSGKQFLGEELPFSARALQHGAILVGAPRQVRHNLCDAPVRHRLIDQEAGASCGVARARYMFQYKREREQEKETYSNE